MGLAVAGSARGTETATRPGRPPLGAQHGDEKPCDVTADPDEARPDRPSDGKRPAVMGEEVLEQPLRGPEMGRAAALARQRDALRGRPRRMQPRALPHAGERPHVTRQRIEHGRGSAPGPHQPSEPFGGRYGCLGATPSSSP
jgi:hypothetical protein